MTDDEKFSIWELTFFRADNPPGESGPYLCSDGSEVFVGEYDASRQGWSRAWPKALVLPVQAWAELPHPEECLEDLRLG